MVFEGNSLLKLVINNVHSRGNLGITNAWLVRIRVAFTTIIVNVGDDERSVSFCPPTSGHIPFGLSKLSPLVLPQGFRPCHSVEVDVGAVVSFLVVDPELSSPL